MACGSAQGRKMALAILAKHRSDQIGRIHPRQLTAPRLFPLARRVFTFGNLSKSLRGKLTRLLQSDARPTAKGQLLVAPLVPVADGPRLVAARLDHESKADNV